MFHHSNSRVIFVRFFLFLALLATTGITVHAQRIRGLAPPVAVCGDGRVQRDEECEVDSDCLTTGSSCDNCICDGGGGGGGGGDDGVCASDGTTPCSSTQPCDSVCSKGDFVGQACPASGCGGKGAKCVPGECTTTVATTTGVATTTTITTTAATTTTTTASTGCGSDPTNTVLVGRASKNGYSDGQFYDFSAGLIDITNVQVGKTYDFKLTLDQSNHPFLLCEDGYKTSGNNWACQTSLGAEPPLETLGDCRTITIPSNFGYVCDVSGHNMIKTIKGTFTEF